MKLYRNVMKVLVPSVSFFAIFAIMSFNFIGSSKPEVHYTGVITLLVLILFLFVFFKLLTSPLIVLKDNEIVINTILNKKVIHKLSDFSLIISNDYLAFRKLGKNDITVSKDSLYKQDWDKLISKLEQVKFKD